MPKITSKSWQILLAVVVCLTAIFLWPTRYRFDKMHMSGDILPVRINRVTGSAEILYPDGWHDVRNQADRKENELTGAELSKLTGTLSFTDTGSIKAQIYNGTDRTVPEILIRITINDTLASQPHGRFWDLIPRPQGSRDFRLVTSGGGPFGYAEFGASAGDFTPTYGQSFSWSILSAKCKAY